jgi:hydrogenase expression/formation protein HypC
VCLAIPARILSIEDKNGWRSATVSVAGAERSVDLSLVPDVTVGDFVVTHAGYAISVLSSARAVETLEMLGIDPGRG